MNHTREFHVATTGDDRNDASADHPLRSIQRAATLAAPGDTITVHAGIYRERVSPPQGGDSDLRRITFQAAPGEHVVISGAEPLTGWEPAGDGLWTCRIPDAFFREHGDGGNPFRELLSGDWFVDLGRQHHAGMIYVNGAACFEVNEADELLSPEPLPEARVPEHSMNRWRVEAREDAVVVTAGFHKIDPREACVEVTARSTVFTPLRGGVDFITVRGFELRHAATPWAPPTGAQTGLIGPNWSRGWIIEHNHIHGARCSGVSLGQDGRFGDNLWTRRRVKHGTQRQREVVFRALQHGWSRDTVGSHIVRHNHIHDCEQTGICGHLGCIFSEITDNDIHDIHVQRRFTGAEIAGIKLHAPIDTLIAGNRMQGCARGLWLDWQAQGTRVTRNLFLENDWEDIFIEVSHGPCVMDHNLLLSATSLVNLAQGSCFAHNLLAGRIRQRGVHNRYTFYHAPHSTAVAGLMTVIEGDDRWYNNLFIPARTDASVDADAANADLAGLKNFHTACGTSIYDGAPTTMEPWQNARTPDDYEAIRLPVSVAANGYGPGAEAYEHEEDAVRGSGAVSWKAEKGKIVLRLEVDEGLANAAGRFVESAMLGQAFQTETPFEDHNGSTLRLDRDYWGHTRTGGLGPFAGLRPGPSEYTVWDLKSPPPTI